LWIHDAEKDAGGAVSILASSAYVAPRLGVLARPTVFVAVEPPADVLLHTSFDGDIGFLCLDRSVEGGVPWGRHACLNGCFRSGKTWCPTCEERMGISGDWRRGSV